jgi:hypothetical protein
MCPSSLLDMLFDKGSGVMVVIVLPYAMKHFVCFPN